MKMKTAMSTKKKFRMSITTKRGANDEEDVYNIQNSGVCIPN